MKRRQDNSVMLGLLLVVSHSLVRQCVACIAIPSSRQHAAKTQRAVDLVTDNPNALCFVNSALKISGACPKENTILRVCGKGRRLRGPYDLVKEHEQLTYMIRFYHRYDGKYKSNFAHFSLHGIQHADTQFDKNSESTYQCACALGKNMTLGEP